MAKHLKRRQLQNVTSQTLEIFLALDRVIVELSLHRYGVSRRDQDIMREQNRRLHDAFRDDLPRILSLSRSPSGNVLEKRISTHSYYRE